MKELDTKSILVAALLGAVALTVFDVVVNGTQPSGWILATGAAVGASVQVGVRFAGVS